MRCAEVGQPRVVRPACRVDERRVPHRVVLHLLRRVQHRGDHAVAEILVYVAIGVVRTLAYILEAIGQYQCIGLDEAPPRLRASRKRVGAMAVDVPPVVSVVVAPHMRCAVAPLALKSIRPDIGRLDDV